MGIGSRSKKQEAKPYPKNSGDPKDLQKPKKEAVELSEACGFVTLGINVCKAILNSPSSYSFVYFCSFCGSEMMRESKE